MKLVPEAVTLFRVQEYGHEPIEGVRVVPLRRFNDDGGSMTELARLAGDAGVQGIDGFRAAQVNHSTVAPGVIKAFHVHKAQTDLWFVPPEDRVLLVLVDIRDGSSSARRAMKMLLGGGSSALVRIPPGVAHGCRNVGDRTATIVYFTDRHFSAEASSTDEGRLPWDLVGAEIWEPAKD